MYFLGGTLRHTLLYVLYTLHIYIFLDDTLELDVSIAEGSIFSIMGSEKRSAQPLPEARMCGKLNTIKEDIDT